MWPRINVHTFNRTDLIEKKLSKAPFEDSTVRSRLLSFDVIVIGL